MMINKLSGLICAIFWPVPTISTYKVLKDYYTEFVILKQLCVAKKKKSSGFCFLSKY